MIKKPMFVIVLVESGIPTDVQLSTSYETALAIRDDWNSNINLEDDDVEIFERIIMDS